MKRIALLALALGAVISTAYADTKISALPSAAAQAGTEVVPEYQAGQCVSTGGTCGVLLSQIKTYTNASLPAANLTGQVSAANGGTGLSTITAHGLMVGEGTSPVAPLAAMAADTVLMGQGASSDPAPGAVTNCGDTSHAVSYSTSTHTWGCQSITGTSASAGGSTNAVQYNGGGGVFSGTAAGTVGQALCYNSASAPAWCATTQVTMPQSVANSNFPIVGANGTTPTWGAGVLFNPSTSVITATTFSGNATNATLAATLTTTSSSTAAQFPPVLANGTSMIWDGSVLINPSTHDVSATTHTGADMLTLTTVAGLPTCNAGNKGRLQAVTDANGPTYNATVTGSGAVSIPVYCNGSNWTAH